MKRLLIMAAAAGAAVTLWSYGVSPSQQSAGQTQQTFTMPNGNGGFQMQPAPQPSNNLAPGMVPPAPGQPQVQATQNIQENIKNYKPDEWAKDWGHIHLDEAKQLANDPTVLFADARSKVEYDQGHIPGAIPMPVGEFDLYYKKYEAKIKKARRIITYCHGIGCKLSDKAAQKLYVDHKMRNIASFFGGWPQWQEHNLPVEVGPEPKKHN